MTVFYVALLSQFQWANIKEGIKLCNLNVLNFFLFYKKSLNFQKFLDKLEQTKHPKK